MPDLQVEVIREASRKLVRELGFMRGTLAGTDLPPSAVHALIEIGAHASLRAAELCDSLVLEKSSVSRMIRRLVEAGEVAEAPSREDARAKSLSLTMKGRATLAGIHGFARHQVVAALACLSPSDQAVVRNGLQAYAKALAASKGKPAAAPAIDIRRGYVPGVIGRCAEMHARYYAAQVGFGQLFEAQVASGLAAFTARLANPANALWVVTRGDEIVGTIAIDGEDLDPGIAHLRWYILDASVRGGGIGRRLLVDAVAFCDQQGFAETHLWTFHGLDAARRLYEAVGFELAEEQPGRQWGEPVLEQRLVRRRCNPAGPAGFEQNPHRRQRVMSSKHIGKPQKSATADIDHAEAAKRPIDHKAHAVPAGAESEKPTGTPTSDRHEMETVHGSAGKPGER